MSIMFIKAGVTLALTCALGLTTFAQTPVQGTATQQAPMGGLERHGRHIRPGGKHDRVGRRALKGLNLTDAQREQLRAIHERNGGLQDPAHRVAPTHGDPTQRRHAHAGTGSTRA